MVWFFTPYSFEGKLFEAYDQYMDLINAPDDWGVLTDGDALFFHPDFGNVIRDHILKYPDTGMFVCYANRTGTQGQEYNEKLADIDSIKYNFLVADRLHRENSGQSTAINCLVSGFLMAVQKKTWMLIREEVRLRVKDRFLLGVDYTIAASILRRGMTIRRMDDLFMLHYYRFVEGNPENRGIK